MPVRVGVHHRRAKVAADIALKLVEPSIRQRRSRSEILTNAERVDEVGRSRDVGDCTYATSRHVGAVGEADRGTCRREGRAVRARCATAPGSASASRAGRQARASNRVQCRCARGGDAGDLRGRTDRESEPAGRRDRRIGRRRRGAELAVSRDRSAGVEGNDDVAGRKRLGIAIGVRGHLRARRRRLKAGDRCRDRRVDR